MEHLHSRLPYAQWSLQIIRRLYLPSGSSSSTFLSRRVHSNKNNVVQADPDTTSTRQDNENTDDNDTSSTISPSQLLPQSPLITNPHPGRAIRHRKKRPPTPDDLSELRNNPWAMALASPVRMCNVTGTRLPKALLTEWGLVEQPGSAADSNPDSNSRPNTSPEGDKEQKGKLWLLPVGLLKDDLADPARNDKGNVATRRHLQFRMVDRIPILQTLSDVAISSRKKKYLPLAPLLPVRWKYPIGPLAPADEPRLIWRLDMPEFVLRKTRLEALKYLKRVSDTLKERNANKMWVSFDVAAPYSEGALLEGLMTGEVMRKESLDRMVCGIFLIFGNGSGVEVCAGPSEVATIPEFVTLPEISRKVPVFDLTWLFSQAELEEIRAYHPRFQKSAAYFRPSNRLTTDAILKLWKLQGYIREHKTST